MRNEAWIPLRIGMVMSSTTTVQSKNAIDGILSIGCSPDDFKLFLQFVA